MKGLRNGWHAGADICFYFREEWGLGIKYSQFFSTAFVGNASLELEGETIFGNLSDNIRSTFIGPFYSYRKVFQKSGNTLYMNIGLGYLDYSDEGEYIINKTIVSGKTLGSVVDIGFDFSVTEHLALGIQLSSVAGTLSQIHEEVDGVVTTYSLEVDELVGIGRIDVSASLKINF